MKVTEIHSIKDAEINVNKNYTKHYKVISYNINKMINMLVSFALFSEKIPDSKVYLGRLHTFILIRYGIPAVQFAVKATFMICMRWKDFKIALLEIVNHDVIYCFVSVLAFFKRGK